MNEAPIIAKSGPAEEELKDRLERGADGIEIQLMHWRPIDEASIRYHAGSIRSIHTDLDYKQDRGLYITDSDQWGREVLEKGFMLAQDAAAAEQHHEPVGVVLHVGEGLKTIDRRGGLDSIRKKAEWLNNYKDTCLYLENGMGTYGSGYEYEGKAELIDMIGTLTPAKSVFDTIHAWNAAYVHVLLCEPELSPAEFHREVEERYERLFKIWSSMHSECAEIHFANAIGNGKIGCRHGVMFRDYAPEDERYFGMTMSFIDKYFRNVPICIEVKEDDYRHAENFSGIRRKILSRSTGKA